MKKIPNNIQGRSPQAKKPEIIGRGYDVNDERIERMNELLDRLPKINRRIEAINKILFEGGITAAEFVTLTRERSALVKQYDDMEREAKGTYRLVMDSEREELEEITAVNIGQ